MSAGTVNRVRRGFYLDSVALMRLSRALAGREGIEEAALMMGTPANKRIMADARLLDAVGEAAGGGDLVIAVRATNPKLAESALAEAENMLRGPRSGSSEPAAWRPRTLRAAANIAPQSNLALISVPGDFAAAASPTASSRRASAMIRLLAGVPIISAASSIPSRLANARESRISATESR